MAKITLLRGETATVDDDDMEVLSKYSWYKSTNGYVVANAAKVRMHRLITGCGQGEEVDHINRNKLDNRKKNLRICTRSENNINRRMFKTNRSGFRGVSFYAPLGKWKAKIVVGGHHTHLGYFENIDDAARAYDRAAKEYFGALAQANFSLRESEKTA